MSTSSLPRITPEEFLRREAVAVEKHQYYQGEVFAMAGGSQPHNRIILNISSRLYSALSGQPCQPISSDVMVKVKSTGLMTYPDGGVICPPVTREPGPIEVILNPRILVEVLSPSTERYDRLTKFTHYEQIESLTDLLLVRQDQPVIEHYSRLAAGPWTPRLVIGLDAEIVFDSIACQLPLAHIYDGVEFPEPPGPPPPVFVLAPMPET